jgi:putative transposase
MDEQYLLATARYIEMNPVAAKLVQSPGEYRWSSAHAHLVGQDDDLVQVKPLLDLVPDWRSFLMLAPEHEVDLLHRHESTGRPLGEDAFIVQLEIAANRILRPQKPGPKKISKS